MNRTLGPVFVLLALLGASILLPPSASAAQLRIFENVEPPFVEGPFIFKNQDVAQSFTATEDYRLLRIEVMVHDLDLSQPLDPIDLRLETDAGGQPSTTVLTTGTADGAFGYNWLSIDLTPPVNIVAGQVYWIVLEDNNDMNQQSGYRWAMTSSDTYPAGGFATRGGGGPWSAPSAEDLLFRTWGIQGPVITAGMSADTTTAGATDPITYTVYFNNSGTEAASFVWANATLSANVTYVSDTASGEGGMSTGPTSWQFVNVAVGAHSFDLEVRVETGVFDGLPIITSTQIEYADPAEILQERSVASVVVTARAPSVSLTKDVTPKFLGPGEYLNYTITIVNAGSRVASFVWVNDTLPPEIEYLGNTADQLANYSSDWFDGTRLHVNVTDLPQGTFSFNISARTQPGLANGTAFVNRVYANYTDSRGVVVPPGASASVTGRIHGASLQVEKQANVDTAGPGQEIRYRIRYENRGNAVARKTWINDTLPPELEYVSDTGGGVLVGSEVRFTFDDLAVGNHFHFLTARVRAGVPDGRVVRNLVTLDHTDSDYSLAPSSQATADVLVTRPLILLTASAPQTADPGDPWDLALTVTNAGNASAAGLWVNLTFPPGLTRVSDDAEAQGGTPTPDGWYFESAAPGTLPLSVEFRVAVGLGDGIVLQVNASSSFLDALGRVGQAVAVNRSVTVTSPVIGLSLTLSRDTVPIGQTLELVVSHDNLGQGLSAFVWLNVTLVGGLSVASASSAWASTTGLVYTWRLSDVGPGNHELRVLLSVDTGTPQTDVVLVVGMSYTDANANVVGAASDSAGFQILAAETPLQTWGIAILVLLVAGLASFIGYRVYGLGSRDRGRILQLFLLHKSGLLIKHYTRSLHASLDSDILAAMLVAVQNFVKESFKFRPGALEEMTFGPHRILLAHGEHTILAALVAGKYLDRLKSVLRTGLEQLESEYGDRLRDWSGVVQEFDGLNELLDQVLRGRMPNRNGLNGWRNGFSRKPSNGL